MKRIVFSIIALLISVAAVQAQLLWKIDGNGVNKPSYLFGTHHIAPITVLDSVPSLRQIINEADKVYGEVVMADMMKPEGVMAIQTAMMAPADSTLSKIFTPEQLDTISNALSTYIQPGLTVQMFEAFKPAMLSTTFASGLSVQAFPDFDVSQQLDATIQSIATEMGKEVGGLETVESQIEVLSGNPISEQAEALMEELRDVDKAIRQARTLATAYRLGDIEAILAEMSKDSDSESDLDRLLYSRNRNWIETMQTQLPAGGALYVVGAGHLPGEQGVINLLRKAGYTVKPM